MRYHALACDYDGTIATNGRVPDSTVESLQRVAASGRKLILVTGRRIDELAGVFPRLNLFDRIVAENGAVVYNPRTREEKLFGEPPPSTFLDNLRMRRVEPLSVGKVIVATWQPHETVVLDAVRESGLELQVIFNKGAVMVLPSGINKAFGLRAALHELELSVHNTVGIGDAENDQAFLSACECSAAVANALDAVKERTDITTRGDHGDGVEELIVELLKDDLQGYGLQRHHILLGRNGEGPEIDLPPYGTSLLIAGPSGSGKTTVLTAILERLSKAAYQFCIVDPEGDYGGFEHAVVLGDERRLPSTEEVLQLLSRFENAVVVLLGVPLGDRPAFAEQLLQRLIAFQSRTGRPHWIILDEAHHLMPASHGPVPNGGLQNFGSSVLVTVHPERVSQAALQTINSVAAVGTTPVATLAEFVRSANLPCLPWPEIELEQLEILLWQRKRSRASPLRVRIEPAEAELRRHRRKYSEGDLQERSFHFRGPKGKLNLRAQNLALFVQIAEGIDDETWIYHLRRGDYSAWMQSAVKDKAMAGQVALIERAKLSPRESRAKIKAVIEKLYTGSA